MGEASRQSRVTKLALERLGVSAAIAFLKRSPGRSFGPTDPDCHGQRGGAPVHRATTG